MSTSENAEKQPATIMLKKPNMKSQSTVQLRMTPSMTFPLLALLACCFASVTNECRAAGDASEPLCVSGVYPHLAFSSLNGECGIGAIVPWAGKLWSITYPPHKTTGSTDKLYEIDDKLNLTIRPESVGGTHACRLIHRESNQLIIGVYFIDEKGNVRAADVKKLTGRMTGIARHLTDPANLVYFYDMEGAVYEVNVHTLEVKKLFEKPVPGMHGKGAYSGQGRLVISNNGEKGAAKPSTEYLASWPAGDREAAGVLAEYDGSNWRIIERRQFTDVTGPGGINGNSKDTDPIWATGWDKRSVILKLLDGGKWSTFRMPKASHAFDPTHGWFTEWPRIREVAPGQAIMTMHGMLWNFPLGFSAANTAGISPICSHLRYVTDVCTWNNRLLISSDDTSMMGNPMAGVSQSNIWFTQPDALKNCGPCTGWGGPWMDDAVKAGEYSVPFLVNGFDQRVLHLVVGTRYSNKAKEQLASDTTEVTFTLETDVNGDGKWSEYKRLTLPGDGYTSFIFPAGFKAQWLRLKSDRNCVATAYLHQSAAGHDPKNPAIFASLADVAEKSVCGGLLRPSANLNLLWAPTLTEGDTAKEIAVVEVNEKLTFADATGQEASKVRDLVKLNKGEFSVDEASVVMEQGVTKYRLPKGPAQFDRPFASGSPRCIREVESERNLMNAHGTFYEMPRGGTGLQQIKPIASHTKQIMDFCTWRGLLVMSGTRLDAKYDGQFFAGADKRGLWFGAVDDLWKLGKPVGKGGPWLKTAVQAGAASDPYLMTGYDKKSVEFSHDSGDPVEFTVEVDFDHRHWVPLTTLTVQPRQPLTYKFSEGFSAHWVRLRAGKPCTASAIFTYE